MKRILSWALMPTLCLCATARAEHAVEPHEMEAVVVTAAPGSDGPTLSQPSLRVAKERMAHTPGGVAVVDTEEVSHGRVSNLTDTFRYSAGVFAQPRFGAEETRLSIRGSGIQRTFHLRGIKLMQDGVPLNQADGGSDFQSVEALSTRYMEVFRGANALQYGGTTLGGAINYVSRTGYDASPLALRMEAGSFDYLRTQAATGGVRGDLDYYASFSTFDQEGFRDHAVQEGRRFNGNAGYRIHEDLETRFYFAWAASDSELPGNLSKAQLKRDPRQANAGNIANDQRRDTDSWRLSNRTVWRFGESRIEALAYYSDYELFHPIFQVIDQDAYTVGAELRFVSDATWAGRENRFIAGYAPSRGRTDEDRFFNVNGRRGARTGDFEQIATTQAFYAENTHFVLQDLALVVGLQHTRAGRDLNDKLNPDNSYEESYSGISPKYGLLYRMDRDVQLYGNVSKSFEPPSFSEGQVLGEPNKAQRGWTYEVGSRGDTKLLNWDVSLYRAELRNELLGIAPSGMQTLTVNVPRTIHQGLEAALGGDIGSMFSWQSALLINDFRFDDDPVYGDNTLPGIPKLLLRAELLYRNSGFYAGPNVEWSPRKYPIDMANSFAADAYAVFGFKLGQQVNRHWSWFVDVRNLFDKQYAATTGVIRDAGGVDVPQFLPGDGRSVFAGLQWTM